MYIRKEVLDKKEEVYKMHFEQNMSVGEIKRTFENASYDDIKNVIISYGKFPITESELKYQRFKSKLPKDILYDLHYNKFMSVKKLRVSYKVQEKYLHRLFTEYNLTPIKDLSPKKASGIIQNRNLSIAKIYEVNETIFNFTEIAKFLLVSDFTLRKFCKNNNIELVLETKNKSEVFLGKYNIDKVKDLLSKCPVLEAQKIIGCTDTVLRRYMKDNNIECTYSCPTVITTLKYKEINDLYFIQRYNTHEIAKLYGISQYTVWMFMKQNNMKCIIWPKEINIDLDEFKKFYIEKYYSMPQLAEHFKVSYDTIKKYMRINKIKLMHTIQKRYHNYKLEIHNDYTNGYLSLVALGQKYNIGADWLGKQLKVDGIYDEYRGIISNEHMQINNYLDSISVVYKNNNRKIIAPYEIDMVLENQNIGIEFHGLYYHSTKHTKDYTYHYRKYKLAKDKGYQLIQIFADEWYIKPDIVKTKLKLLLSHNPLVNNYEIKKISENKQIKFCNNNHLEGHGTGKINYAIFVDNILTSLINVSTKDNIDYTIERFCTTRCNSDFKLLFDYFKLKHSFRNVYSSIELRWDSDLNNIFIDNNFKDNGYSKISYSYTSNFTERINKEAMHKSIKNLNENKHEYFLKNKFYKVYDCGRRNYVYQCT